MSENSEKDTQNPNLSSLITNLISNPEMISKMGDILSKIEINNNQGISPQEASNNNNCVNNSPQSPSINTENVISSPTLQSQDVGNILLKLPEFLSKISSSKSEDSVATKQQIALLLAIRPYLSDHRKELIDTFIKMNRLGSIFKNLT